ncbi:MAG: carbohydrate binding domain-containing protein, partial [Planctomycetota bacterium]
MVIFAVGLQVLLFAGEERNLVGNGAFEEGAPGATKIPGWTEVDGLTTFFVSEQGRGRVLLIDTDVNLSEANARWEEMKLPPAERPAAQPKGPTHEPKYDTVGGTTGAKIYSDYIRVEPGMRYRLKVDVKSDHPTVKIFIKGYAQFEGGFRKFYQCYKNIEKPEPGWHTYERTFNPTLKSKKVTHIRVMPYAYWPPGRAWVDRVEIKRVGIERPEGATRPRSLLANGDFEAKLTKSWRA